MTDTIDYAAEIISLKRAIAAGVLEVKSGDTTTRYDTGTSLLARLAWLESQLSLQTTGASRPMASYASFSRGDLPSGRRTR